MRHAIGIVVALATGLAGAGSAQAQDDWTFEITPYIWIGEPKGDVAAFVQDAGPPVGTRFEDVGLSGFFAGTADARYGRFGVVGDVTYFSVDADNDISIGSLPPASGEVEVAGTKAMIVGYYRAYETETSAVDVLAGVHYFRGEVDAKLIGPNRQFSRSAAEDLWDPVIGVRGKTRLSKHFGLLGLATYGGFGVSSDSLYELQGYVTYSFTPAITAEVGYRYYSADFSGDRIDYNAALGGPVIGVTFGF